MVNNLIYFSYNFRHIPQAHLHRVNIGHISESNGLILTLTGISQRLFNFLQSENKSRKEKTLFFSHIKPHPFG